MLRYVLRATLAMALMFGASSVALAQYPGGGMGGGGGMPEAQLIRLTAMAPTAPSLAESPLVRPLAPVCSIGSSTTTLNCKAAWLAMEISSSTKRTIKPTPSPTSK